MIKYLKVLSKYLMLTVGEKSSWPLSSNNHLRTKYYKCRHFPVALRNSTSSLLQFSMLFLFETPPGYDKTDVNYTHFLLTCFCQTISCDNLALLEEFSSFIAFVYSIPIMEKNERQTLSEAPLFLLKHPSERNPCNIKLAVLSSCVCPQLFI